MSPVETSSTKAYGVMPTDQTCLRQLTTFYRAIRKKYPNTKLAIFM